MGTSCKCQQAAGGKTALSQKSKSEHRNTKQALNSKFQTSGDVSTCYRFGFRAADLASPLGVFRFRVSILGFVGANPCRVLQIATVMLACGGYFISLAVSAWDLHCRYCELPPAAPAHCVQESAICEIDMGTRKSDCQEGGGIILTSIWMAAKNLSVSLAACNCAAVG
jgi:hypothetical protein